MGGDLPDYTRQVTVNVFLPAPSGVSVNPKSFEDVNFTAGETGRVLDVNAALGRNGQAGYFVNYGSGDIKVEFSNDGTAYGGVHLLHELMFINLSGLDVDSIRLTWVSDTEYICMVV